MAKKIRNGKNKFGRTISEESRERISAHRESKAKKRPDSKIWHGDITAWMFCDVIDNFGDIGVTYRLARSLANEKGWKPILWVNDLDAFHSIESKVNPGLEEQSVGGIEVRRWNYGPAKENSASGIKWGADPDEAKEPIPVEDLIELAWLMDDSRVADEEGELVDGENSTSDASAASAASASSDATEGPGAAGSPNGRSSESPNEADGFVVPAFLKKIKEPLMAPRTIARAFREYLATAREAGGAGKAPKLVVIEMFCVDAPECVKPMAGAAKAKWIIWDYLVFSKNAAANHLAPSPHEYLDRCFFEMGVEKGSGGLIIEKSRGDKLLPKRGFGWQYDFFEAAKESPERLREFVEDNSRHYSGFDEDDAIQVLTFAYHDPEKGVDRLKSLLCNMADLCVHGNDSGNEVKEGMRNAGFSDEDSVEWPDYDINFDMVLASSAMRKMGDEIAREKLPHDEEGIGHWEEYGEAIFLNDFQSYDCQRCMVLDLCPMVPQEFFDDLISCHQILLVRGEDSLVRALSSGVPFLWHAYPQDDDHALNQVRHLYSHVLPSMPFDIALSMAIVEFWLNSRRDFGFWEAVDFSMGFGCSFEAALESVLLAAGGDDTRDALFEDLKLIGKMEKPAREQRGPNWTPFMRYGLRAEDPLEEMLRGEKFRLEEKRLRIFPMGQDFLRLFFDPGVFDYKDPRSFVKTTKPGKYFNVDEMRELVAMRYPNSPVREPDLPLPKVSVSEMGAGSRVDMHGNGNFVYALQTRMSMMNLAQGHFFKIGEMTEPQGGDVSVAHYMDELLSEITRTGVAWIGVERAALAFTHLLLNRFRWEWSQGFSTNAFLKGVKRSQDELDNFARGRTRRR